MADLSHLSDDELRQIVDGGNDVSQLSDKELLDIIRKGGKKQVSAMEDSAKAAAYAIPKAAVGLAGLPADAYAIAKMGKQKLLSALPDWVGKADAAIPGAADAIKLLPTSGQLRGAAEKVTGPWYDPQTWQGKAVDTATQTAATLGRNWITAPARAALTTAGITAGTEGAGALTEGTVAEPWARVGGGLLGGGIPVLFNAMKTRTGTIVKDALGPITQNQIDNAIAMQSRARDLGVPLLGTESLDRGHQLASAVYAHPSGNQTIEGFLRGRPQQVGSAVNREIIAQTGARDIPSSNAARAQQAATDVISNAEKARTAAVAPFYKAAQYETIPPSAMRPVAQAIEGQIYGNAIGSPADRSLGAWYQQAFPNTMRQTVLPETNVGRLGELYKRLGIERELPAVGATADQKIAAYPAGKVQDALGDVLKANNPNMRTAQRAYSAITENKINPLTAGPVGLVAGKRGIVPGEASPIERVVSSVTNQNVRPENIRELYTNLNQQDKLAFPGIVQTHLENQLNAALGDLRSGPNPTAGQKFRQAIVGTPQEQKNFDEMMRGVAQARGQNPDSVVSGANNLLEVLDRTGRTPGMGSQTAPRGEVNKEMGKTLLGDTLSTVSLTPLKPAGRRFDDWIMRSRYANVAKALTAPDSVQILAKMAKLNPNGITASYYAAVLLGMDKAIAAGQ